jgi:3',5'-cyclic AMP phosphodiesterase CpdA
MNEDIRQVEIIHLSDIHFGDRHRFIPARTPDGSPPSSKGMPTLLEKLQEDLVQSENEYPVVGGDAIEMQPRKAPTLVCITGDLATTGTYKELQQAREFITNLKAIQELRLDEGMRSIFIVPGNHDILWEENEIGARWREWASFYNNLYSSHIPQEKPWGYVELYKLKDIGVVVLCLNSEIYVRKDSPKDNYRGEVDQEQLTKVQKLLDAISPQELDSMIRVALIHHHPILIPSLAEPDRGYDAVIGSGELLQILHRHGFHLLLHGHKHHPHTLLDDIRGGFHTTAEQPMVIVAGGSAGAGASDLPIASNGTNCYNRITVKWHPKGGYTRIKVTTRGLVTYYPDHTSKLPSSWTWETLREDDRFFSTEHHVPTPKVEARTLTTHSQLSNQIDLEEHRTKEYARTRGNMAVVDVRPSLVEGQFYEARFWIDGRKRRGDEDVPEEVTWSAGPKFPIVSIRREGDRHFCATYDYYGPMLIQAYLKFSNGPPALTYVYARVPDASQ